MLNLNKLSDDLNELMNEQDCGHCDMNCPYYINGNYGHECALDIVINELSIKMYNAKK